MLQFPDTAIDLLAVTGVKNFVAGNSEPFCQIFSAGKMHIAVPEFSHSLIMLGISWGIKDTGIFPGNGKLTAQINFIGVLNKRKR